MPLGKNKIDKIFVEQLKISWASSNNPTELRFILGHKKPISIYLTTKEVDKKLSDLEAEVYVDRVQTEKRTIAGYLAGPIINERTAEIIADILIENRIFTANKITQLEIYEETITINQGNNKTRKATKRSKAMHIMVPDDAKAITRSCLAKLFPSKPRGDYPLGIQYRFVPNTADTDFAISKTARRIAQRLMTKQACFLDNCIQREHRHFNDLFIKHDTMPNITLIKVLMALKSKRFPERQLFLCIEQEYEEGPVFFQYSSELQDEADGIIPVIPLYLEGKFGQSISKWMKPSATIGTAGYTYDSKSNRVTPLGNNILNNLNDDWEQQINKYDYDDDSLSDIESDDGQSGFAIEFGELDFENDKRRTNLNDDTASLGTMGLQVPTDFVDLEADDSDDGEKNTPIRGVKQGTIPGPASEFASLITPSLSGPEDYSSLKLPPKIQSLPEEDRITFMKLINNVKLMKLLQEIPPLEDTAPSKQDGGGYAP